MEIAIIAHDGKKADMVQFLNKNRALLLQENIKLIATGTTGSRAEAGGFKVKKMLSGPLGGDAQIAARVAEGKTKMVLFFMISVHILKNPWIIPIQLIRLQRLFNQVNINMAF